MTIFFTGCTHFNHANIIKLANRPFADVQEMNDRLEENWNKEVGPNDTVYHLGDISWGDISTWIPYLNGKKILIRGNHDPLLQDIPSYAGFDHVYDYHELRTGGSRIVLFHYPIDDWNGRWQGSIHLHCHTHKKEFRNPNLPFDAQSGLSMPSRFPPDIKCNRFNVGVDACNFTPVSLEEIIEEALK